MHKMAPNGFTRSLVLFNSLIVLLFCCLPAIAAGQQKPNILILNSYERNMEWTESQTQAILDTFRKDGFDPLFSIEYMDWKSYPSETNLKLQYQLFTYKYKNMQIDLIMTTDDAALKFALQHRRELFSDAPVVFCGVYSSAAQRLTANQTNVFGVYEVPEIEQTGELMVRFDPGLAKVYLLNDDLESGLLATELMKSALDRVKPNLSVVTLNHLTYPEVLETLEAAPDHSAVLVGTYSRDAAGYTLEASQYTKLFAEKSRVPLYVLYDFNMGSGAVAGTVVSGRMQGLGAAKLGSRLLHRETISDTDMFADAGHRTIVDYPQLEKYHLRTDAIPPDSEIINYPETFYTRYQQVIWAAAAVFLIMLAYIAILIFHIRKRKQAEAHLQKNNNELTALYEEVLSSQDELQFQYQQVEKVRDALSQSEERYKLAFAGANDGLWDWDILADEMYFSDLCCELIQIKQNRITNFKQFFLTKMQAGQNPAIVAGLEAHLAGKTDYFSYEIKITTEDGDKWIAVRSKALFDADGKPVRMAGSLSDITLQKDREERIHYLAYHDALTGLGNRQFFYECLESILRQPDEAMVGALLVIDIDNFKVLNDTFGHLYGDKVLQVIGRMLVAAVGDAGYAVRMGGDEFVIILRNIKDRYLAASYGETLLRMLAAPFQVDERSFFITVSVGITLFPQDGITTEKLLKNADLAMYQAKSAGKNQYDFFNTAMERRLRERTQLEADLREAVRRDEFVLWYQPLVELASGEISGFEALVRWDSRERGLVSPFEFIKTAEETGLIVPIGRRIFRDACEFASKLRREGYGKLKININISVLQLLQNDFLSSVRSIIRDTQVEAQQLAIEITEGILLESSEANIQKLQELKEIGISIYLDDFGTGYSSLNYLKDLPIDVVKIDKSFIKDIDAAAEDKQLTEVIIGLAHRIGLKTVAEGVETEQQLRRLLQYHCDTAQGYFFSRPLPRAEAEKLLKAAGEGFSVLARLKK